MKHEKGQAVVEYAIMFPILLMFTLGIIQLSLLFVARHVVEYAAFCAARAMLVEDDPEIAQGNAERAAHIVCSAIAGRSGVQASSNPIEIPGWGVLPRYAASERKTRVERVGSREPDVITPETAICVEVTHEFELIVPVVNSIVYKLGDPRVGMRNVSYEKYGAPHVPIHGRATLARPWSVPDPDDED